MSKSAQTKLIHSKSLLHPSPYVAAMYNQYYSWVFDEEDCLSFKGKWRQQVFNTSIHTKLDLEIGPGSGDFFAFIAANNKDRLFIAVELKYKPLIQTTRKIKEKACLNAKTIRYNARMLGNIFAHGELNNIYIHFPDPWPKKRHNKHRLIKPDFINELYQLQTNNSFIELKTDHKEYFQEIHTVFKNSHYREVEYSHNLHNNKSLSKEFITQFEKIFIRKKQAVHYLKYTKYIAPI